MVNLSRSKATKYKNNHMYKIKNIQKQHKLDYGSWGVVSCESAVITPNQIESSRCCISRNIKNKGQMWVKVLPNHIISKKSKDSRMGSGKGKFFKFIFVLKPGDVIFEATNIPFIDMIKIFRLVKKKLPVKVKLLMNKNDF